VWFWSGRFPREDERSDIPAYNRATGIMWLTFSVILWINTILGLLNIKADGIGLIAGCMIGVPLLPVIYGKIYNKYRK